MADDAECWTTNEVGVFVSSDNGDDTNGDGTREKPYASIGKGISSSAGKHVYVCLGTADAYVEKVSITEEADGVKIYGGFECTNWTHDVARYVTVESPEPIALRVASLKQGAQIENIHFIAAQGTATDKSSYGAFITDTQGLLLRRVQLTAGDGAKGADGDAGAKGEDGAAAGPAPAGKAAVCPPTTPIASSQLGGDWGLVDHCGSVGGMGGTAFKTTAIGDNGGAGAPTEHVNPLSGIENGGAGATNASAGGDGDDGMAGDAGTLAAAAPLTGTFSKTGFSVADGKAGANGYPGQGGGGGGASKGSAACLGASGGAGGMGGCGGKAGGAGQGGGASIGLFSWNSSVSLEACNVAAASGGGGGGGGKGGESGRGADGGSGGLGDSGDGIADGGEGGNGGPGGNGGSGSGGTGGPSYAIAWSGMMPLFTEPDSTVTEGEGGDAGIGGKVLEAKAPDGSPGDAAAVFEIP